MTKHDKIESWLAPVKLYDAGLACAIEAIHASIMLADDIADRAIKPNEVSNSLWEMVLGLNYFIQHPEKWERIHGVMQRIYRSEVNNQTFIPGGLSVEMELEIWKTRADLLDLYFEAWIIADPSFDTDKNREWFKEFKKHVLILDDCRDIETLTFEDLRQCKRNYVVLKTLGPEGYFGWERNAQELSAAAQSIRETLSLAEPEDSRLKAFMRA